MAKKKLRRSQNKKGVLHYCKQCNMPINERMANSDKFQSFCNRCYRDETEEHISRKTDKKEIIKRKKERSEKHSL